MLVLEVRELFEGTSVTFEFAQEEAELRHDSVAGAVACYATTLGPVMQARTVAEAAGAWPALRDDLTGLFARHHRRVDGGGWCSRRRTWSPWVVARRAASNG